MDNRSLYGENDNVEDFDIDTSEIVVSEVEDITADIDSENTVLSDDEFDEEFSAIYERRRARQAEEQAKAQRGFVFKFKKNNKTNNEISAASDGQNEFIPVTEVEDSCTKPVSKARKIGKIFARIGLYVGTFLLIIVITLLSAIAIICKGPSTIVRDMFVMAMTETGQMDFLAYIFLSDEEVKEILDAHEIIVPEGDTDTSLIQVGGNKDDDSSQEDDFDINGLEIIPIKGKTYKGKLMIVNDPSRVTVGTAAAYGDDCVGYTTLKMAELGNSIAAINGGGYEDRASNKTGGIPMGRNESGVVIAGGELKYGSKNTTYEIIGLDKNGILHVDNMTAQEALNRGIRDAVNWGPILVKNGEPCIVPSDGVNVGFHPRSAIGQRADGAILLLVVDGRQANSMGASYDDLIEIMMTHGAVNAANLDGGMSSYMVYEGKIITEPYLLYDARNVATSWLVSRVKE